MLPLSPYGGSASADILSEYLTRAQLAHALRCSERTLARYECSADGLPSVLIAGRKLYHINSVKNWLASRETRPNPRRTGPGGRHGQ
jgi:hypothetical protein